MKAAEILDLIHDELFEVVEANGHQLFAMAVLERALIDAVSPAVNNEGAPVLRKVRNEALGWFLVDRGVVTFSMVCDLLGVERDRMLVKVKAHIEGKHVSRI